MLGIITKRNRETLHGDHFHFVRPPDRKFRLHGERSFDKQVVIPLLTFDTNGSLVPRGSFCAATSWQ